MRPASSKAAAVSTVPERKQFHETVPPRILVPVPTDRGSCRSRARVIAVGTVVVGLVLAVGVVVAVFVDRGHGSAPISRVVKAAAAAKRRVLPVVVGAHVQLAQSVLQSEGFSVQIQTVSGASPAGTVIGESPAGGRPVASNTPIRLTVSNG